MNNEMKMFMEIPNLLMCGDGNGIIYDRKETEQKFTDGTQRTTSNSEDDELELKLEEKILSGSPIEPLYLK